MKEARNLDKLIVFRERFLDEQTVRANFGIPTAVTFSQGVGSFVKASLSKIVYSNINLNGTYTVRIRFTSVTPVNNDLIIDFRGSDGSRTGYIVCSPTVTGTYEVSSGTRYSDGVASSVLTSSTREIIVTGISIATSYFTVASRYNGTPYLTADMDLIEIYQGTLTANEISNLYNQKRYRNDKISDSTEKLGDDFCPNGNFATNDTWTLGTNAVITGGQLVVTNSAAGAGSNVYLTFGETLIKTNKYYKITVKVDELSGGNLVVRNSSGSTAFTVSTTGIKTGYLAYTTDTNVVFSIDTAGGSYKVDYITIQEVQNVSILMDFDSTKGTLEDKSGLRTLTPTDIAIKKFSSIYGAYFNGATSKIDCGSEFISTKNITYNAWIYPQSFVSTGEYFISNNKFGIRTVSSNNGLFGTSDEAIAVSAAANSVLMGRPVMVTVTRNSVGRWYYYINGALSGTASLNSGTPTNGTFNVFLGSRNTTYLFRGFIFTTQIFEGFASTDQISQWYSSQKLKYNL